MRGQAVIRTGCERPPPTGQRAWRHYVKRYSHGRLEQEWWMPPFLVPIAAVSQACGGRGEEAAAGLDRPCLWRGSSNVLPCLWRVVWRCYRASGP